MGSTDLFPVDPDYAVADAPQGGVLRQASQSGRSLQRIVRPPQRLFRLGFRMRSTDEVEQLRDWHARFQHDFFLFNHKTYINNAGVYLPRHFPVVFAAEPEYELASNEAWNIGLELVEAVGEHLNTFFLEEDSGSAVAGTWNPQVSSAAHNGYSRVSNGNNTTDRWKWASYTGYGFKLWAPKNVDRGIAEIFLDGVSLGTVDLYNASGLASAPVLTKLDVAFGSHLVEMKATNTKNAASSNFFLTADAIEVFPAPTAPVGVWPDPAAGHPTHFQEEHDGSIVAGAWTQASSGAGHGAAYKVNAGTDITHAFQWVYAGYGFRLWAPKNVDRGIVEVLLDGVSLGRVDLYNAAGLGSDVLLTKTDVPLGLHRVKLKATNTKNAASSNFFITADAIEVIP